MTDCLLALGANLGDRAATLDAAVKRIKKLDGVTNAKPSHWHASTPVGGPAGQGEFLNGAMRLSTTLSPPELLDGLQAIESELGRERRVRWAARTVDIDVLLFGDQVIDRDQLEIPHPRMTFRPFVMAPAVEIAGDLCHPQLETTLADLWRQLRYGEDRLVIQAADDRKRDALTAAIAPQLQRLQANATRSLVPGPKLQICLGEQPELLPGIPTLWTTAADIEQQTTDTQAAIQCVWPE